MTLSLFQIHQKYVHWMGNLQWLLQYTCKELCQCPRTTRESVLLLLNLRKLYSSFLKLFCKRWRAVYHTNNWSTPSNFHPQQDWQSSVSSKGVVSMTLRKSTPSTNWQYFRLWLIVSPPAESNLSKTCSCSQMTQLSKELASATKNNFTLFRSTNMTCFPLPPVTPVKAYKKGRYSEALFSPQVRKAKDPWVPNLSSSCLPGHKPCAVLLVPKPVLLGEPSYIKLYLLHQPQVLLPHRMMFHVSKPLFQTSLTYQQQFTQIHCLNHHNKVAIFWGNLL